MHIAQTAPNLTHSKRHTVTRFLSGIVLVGISIGLSPSSLIADGAGHNYILVDLGIPDEQSATEGHAVNLSGEVVGYSRPESYEIPGRALHVDAFGDSFLLEAADEDAKTTASDINSFGEIVGAEVYGTWQRAILWIDGQHHDLGVPDGGTGAHAEANNDLGQITGYYVPENSWIHAYLYDDGEMVDIGTLGGRFAYGSDISEAGDIVGYSEAKDRNQYAYVWSEGNMISLGSLGGIVSEAHAINDIGQIVGSSETATNDTRAFIWQSGQMLNLGTLGYNRSIAFDLNNSTEVVGYTYLTTGEKRAFLWTDISGMQDVNDLVIEGGSDITMTVATGISDSGVICGYGVAGDGSTHAIKLVPTGIRQLAVTPGLSGGMNIFSVTDATPGATVTFYYGNEPGRMSIAGCNSSIQLDIHRPVSMGQATADANGYAQIIRVISEDSKGHTFYLQCLQQDSRTDCCTSNMIVQSFR